MMELELSGNVQIVFYKPTKFCEIPSRDLRGPVLTNFSLLYSIYGQSSKFKGAEISRKMMESEFRHSMLICTLCPKFLRSFTNFQNKIICKKIRLMEFILINICCTLFDDFLVTMVKHTMESKVVRYYSKRRKVFQKMAKVTQVNLYFLRTFQSNIKMRTGIGIFVLLITLQIH